MSATTTTTTSGSAVTTVTKTKPGWQTTEFWLTALANVASLLYLSNAIGDNTTAGHVLALGSAALVNAGYAVSRGIAKKPAGSSS